MINIVTNTGHKKLSIGDVESFFNYKVTASHFSEQDIKVLSDIDYDVSNILCIDPKDKIDAIKAMTEGLIIIDRADAFLSKDDVSYIRSDKNNTYLIMSRCNLDLGISPNYYAELVNNDGIIELKYEYCVEE